jgi:hypothetical protein
MPTPVIFGNDPAGWYFPRKKLNARSWSDFALQKKARKNPYLQLRLLVMHKNISSQEKTSCWLAKHNFRGR